MNEGWNFHGHIALELETKAKKFFNNTDCINKIYSADSIESGCFVEVMIFLLREKSQMDSNEKIDDFIVKSKPYLQLSGREIEPKKAQELYNDFLFLFK